MPNFLASHSGFHQVPEPQATLQGLGDPFGIISRFTEHSDESTVKIREKTISLKDDFIITTPVDDTEFFRAKGKFFSVRSTVTLYDAHGTPVLNIRNKILAVNTTFNIFAGEDDNQQIAQVRSHPSWSGEKFTITFKNFDGRDVELKLKGDFLQLKALITWNDIPLARIDRSFLSGKQLLFEDQTYYLTVAPQVDIALITAICICLYEKSNQDKAVV